MSTCQAHRSLLSLSTGWLIAICVSLALPAPTAQADEEVTTPPAGVPAGAGEAEASQQDAIAKPLLERDLRELLFIQDQMCASKQRATARKLFRSALRDKPDSAMAGFLYARLRDSRSGRRQMREALERRLGLPVTRAAEVGAGWDALARAHIMAEEYEAAAEAAAYARRLLPSANAYALEGWIAQRRGQPERAMHRFIAALRMDKWHMDTRFALVPLLLQQNEIKAALGLALETLTRNTRSAVAHMHWGMALAAGGNAKAARAAYGTALELVGRDPDRVAAIAAALRRIGDAKLARARIDAALEDAPEHYGLLLNRGLIEVDEGRYETAAEYFNRARKIRPREASTHYLYGVCLERSGRARKAISVLKKATRYAPKTLVYRLALGRAYQADDRHENAIAVFRKAARDFPESTEAQQTYARALFDDKRYKHSAKEYERLIELQPDAAYPRYMLAIVYGYHLGQGPRAYKLLQEYVDLGGKEPGALRWLKQLQRELDPQK